MIQAGKGVALESRYNADKARRTKAINEAIKEDSTGLLSKTDIMKMIRREASEFIKARMGKLDVSPVEKRNMQNVTKWRDYLLRQEARGKRQMGVVMSDSRALPESNEPPPHYNPADASIPRASVLKEFEGNPGPCPHCGGRLSQHTHTYLVATRSEDESGDAFILGSDFG